MQKILLILIMMAIMPLIGLAQTVNFELQADGTFLNKQDGKDFVVLVKEGKTNQELYEDVLKAVTKTYVSPHDVISKVDGEIITVNGISEDCISFKGWMGVNVIFSIQYNLKFQFKNGKIRVDSPVITRFFTDDSPDIKPFSGWLRVQKVFVKDKPNPKKQNTIDDFNNTINGLINRILSTNDSEEEW